MMFLLSLPPFLHWAASGPDVAGGKPDDPGWALPSSSIVSSEKTLVPSQHVFLDDSMDTRLMDAVVLLTGENGE